MRGGHQHHSTNEYKLIMCNLCTLNLTPSFRSEIHAEIGLKSFCVAFIISVFTYAYLCVLCIHPACERARTLLYVFMCYMMLLCCTVSPKFIVRSSKLYTHTHTSPKHYLSSKVDSVTVAAAVVTASEST